MAFTSGPERAPRFRALVVEALAVATDVGLLDLGVRRITELLRDH